MTFKPIPDALWETLPLPPDDLLEQAEKRFLLSQALERMRPERRVILDFCQSEQLSAPEIARRLGLPINTVYSRLRLAKQDLTQEIRALRRAPLRPTRSSPKSST
jgi:RNA polymerase sigma-70 factor (ECF subfamily)